MAKNTGSSSCKIHGLLACPIAAAAAARPGLMATALQRLPADKPRVVVGVVSTVGEGCLHLSPITYLCTSFPWPCETCNCNHPACKSPGYIPMLNTKRAAAASVPAAAAKVAGLNLKVTRHCVTLMPAILQASPEEVLEAVSQGVDLFDCSYPTHATAQGYALCFPLRPQQEQQQHQHQHGCADADCGADDSKLNLWSLQYR
jgi:hypothetical protein